MSQFQIGHRENELVALSVVSLGVGVGQFSKRSSVDVHTSALWVPPATETFTRNMGACGSQPNNNNNNVIDKKLHQMNEIDKLRIKLLLLGAGER